MKLLRMVSVVLCSWMILIFCLFSFACANDTTKAEIEFSLQYMNILPKKGGVNFDKCLEMISRDSLKINRLNNLKNKNDQIEKVYINEKNIYDQINGKVKKLIENVDDSTPKSGMTEDEILDAAIISVLSYESISSFLAYLPLTILLLHTHLLYFERSAYQR